MGDETDMKEGEGREESRERGRGGCASIVCTLLNIFDWCMFLFSRVQCDCVRASNAKC